MSIQEKIRYGAAELKNVYSRNLGLALGISVGAHLVLIGLYIFAVSPGSASSEKKAPIVNKTTLSDLTPPPEKENTPPPPPPPMVPPSLQTGGTGGGVASYAGNPVPVPDALVAPDANFATTTEIQVATDMQGTGGGMGDDTSGNGLNTVKLEEPVKVKEENIEKDPDPDEFIPDATPPSYDPAEVLSHAKYPPMARQNGIEGDVVILVLVGKDGSLSKPTVVRSDNKLFDAAATDAVMASTFKPAIQNKVPIKAWVNVTVKFKLDNSN